MKTAPISFLPVLPCSRPTWAVLVGLFLSLPVVAAAPAAPAPLRLSDPQERALLVDRINEAIEQTNQKHAKPRRPPTRRGKAKDEPRYTIPTLAVEFGAPPPSRKRTANKGYLASTTAGGAGTAMLLAPELYVPTATAGTVGTAVLLDPEIYVPAVKAGTVSTAVLLAPEVYVPAATAGTTSTAVLLDPEIYVAKPVAPQAGTAAGAASTAVLLDPEVYVAKPATPLAPASVVRSAPVQSPAAPLQEIEATTASRRYIAERAANLAQAQVASSLSSSGDVDAVPWSYAGSTGPQAWGQLHPSFATCANGQRQSPIELAKPPEKSGPTAVLPLGNQVFGGVLEHTGRFLELQVQGLSTLSLRGMEWELQRVQIRYPAEERIGPTEGIVMAVDLLYRAPTNQWAVVSVPLQLGTPNPFVAQLWRHLPLHAGERVLLAPGELQIFDLLPAQRHYYQYLGSLTTPPCTEGVLRLVLKTPGTVAPEQFQRLIALLPPHARPPQPLYGRQVLMGP